MSREHQTLKNLLIGSGIVTGITGMAIAYSQFVDNGQPPVDDTSPVRAAADYAKEAEATPTLYPVTDPTMPSPPVGRNRFVALSREEQKQLGIDTNDPSKFIGCTKTLTRGDLSATFPRFAKILFPQDKDNITLTEVTTREDLIECLKTPVAREMSRQIGIDPDRLTVEDIAPRTTYENRVEAIQSIAPEVSETQILQTFDTEVTMFFQENGVVKSGKALFLQSKEEVDLRRSKGEVGIFWIGEDNWFFFKQDGRVHAVRGKCINGLEEFVPIPKPEVPPPTGPQAPAPTETPVPPSPPTETPVPPSPPTATPILPTPTTTPERTATPFPPQPPIDTPTPSTEVPPTSTPFVTITPFPTETPVTPLVPTPQRPTATPFIPQPAIETPTASANIPPTSTPFATITPFPTETPAPPTATPITLEAHATETPVPLPPTATPIPPRAVETSTPVPTIAPLPTETPVPPAATSVAPSATPFTPAQPTATPFTPGRG